MSDLRTLHIGVREADLSSRKPTSAANFRQKHAPRNSSQLALNYVVRLDESISWNTPHAQEGTHAQEDYFHMELAKANTVSKMCCFIHPESALACQQLLPHLSQTFICAPVRLEQQYVFVSAWTRICRKCVAERVWGGRAMQINEPNETDEPK